MYRFRVRAHGSLDSSGKAVNQFTHNGNTPTGLVVRLTDLYWDSPVCRTGKIRIRALTEK